MFRRSLDALGGMYENAAVEVTFGDERIRPLPNRWVPHFNRITTHYVDPARYVVDGYFAQIDQRWSNIEREYDIVVFADADTMVLRRFDELVERLLDEPAVAGTIAHYPLPHRPGENPAEIWQSLALEFVGQRVELGYSHTLVAETQPVSKRQCPFYVNFGFVCVSGQLLRTLRDAYLPLRSAVAGKLAKPYFAGQVALTLAAYAKRLPRIALDLKYNFPNDPVAEAMHHSSLIDMRVIHYLRTRHFDRQRIFGSRRSFDEFLDLPLRGSEQVFQDHVRQLTDSAYPF